MDLLEQKKQLNEILEELVVSPDITRVYNDTPGTELVDTLKNIADPFEKFL